jgi:hypothetical protein
MVELAEIQAAYYMVAATGVLVAAAYYILNLRQTIENRKAQLFLQLYSQYYNKDWLESLRKTTYEMRFKDPHEFMEKYGPEINPEAYKGFDMLSHYFEGAGVMVKRGLIDPSMVSDLLAEEFFDYWEKYSPIFINYRKEVNNPRVCENQEYLYDLLKRLRPAGAIGESSQYARVPPDSGR